MDFFRRFARPAPELTTALALAFMLTGCAAAPLSQEPAPTTTPGVTAAPAVSSPTAPVVPAAPTPTPAEPMLEITVSDEMPWAETWEPPTFDGVYQVVDDAHGFPADGTQYLLAHARTPWRGHSPGNDWVDQVTEPGQVVTIDGVRYTVGAIGTVDKPSLAEAGIWGAHDPDKAVLITCVPLITGETATQNRIITLTKEAL